MKKLTVIMSFFILFSLTSSYADEFYCPFGDRSFDINRDIYDPNDGCKQWDTEFWKQCDPYLYSNCLKNQLILRKKYFEGKCENILSKTHTSNAQSCTVKYSSKSKRYISISCRGATKEFRNKVKDMYKQTRF